MLDADICGYFDAISHEWLVKFIEHRIADRRVVRLIQKWLNAGVLEDGERMRSEAGTPQGGVVSPLLANIYLHYAFDLWVRAWRRRAKGDVIVVRFADDIVVGFQYEWEAGQFWTELRERFAAFGLELHPEKTRLIEFGRHAAENRKRNGRGKPETFNFLGFTHVCGKTRKGRFALVRLTMRQRLRAKLREVKEAFRWRWHDPVPEVGKWLASIIRGHFNYYAVPLNFDAVEDLLQRGRPPVATRPVPPKPQGTRHLEAYVPHCGPLPPTPPHRASLARRTAMPSDLRQEPSAVILRAGICAGGAGQPASLPQTSSHQSTAGRGHIAEGTPRALIQRLPQSRPREEPRRVERRQRRLVLAHEQRDLGADEGRGVAATCCEPRDHIVVEAP